MTYMPGQCGNCKIKNYAVVGLIYPCNEKVNTSSLMRINSRARPTIMAVARHLVNVCVESFKACCVTPVKSNDSLYFSNLRRSATH